MGAVWNANTVQGWGWGGSASPGCLSHLHGTNAQERMHGVRQALPQMRPCVVHEVNGLSQTHGLSLSTAAAGLSTDNTRAAPILCSLCAVQLFGAIPHDDAIDGARPEILAVCERARGHHAVAERAVGPKALQTPHGAADVLTSCPWRCYGGGARAVASIAPPSSGCPRNAGKERHIA